MSEDQLIGQQLDEYRLEKLLGQGGMARVYRGLDIGLKRYAAIKVIDTPFRRDEEYLRRFEVEAQAIAQLDHPNIVSLYRYGQAHDVLYMAMKYVEGADLHAVLTGYEENGELMPWDEVMRLMREITSALDYAHNKGVIHRDIKPSNIMIDVQGRAYLTDFGLALLTAQGTHGQVFGTPQYIAPEQAISSAGAVSQSDFYAIGVILYRLVTGVLPFDHDDLLEIAMLHMTEPPPLPSQYRPEIEPDLEAVILKSLAKEPKDRYSDGTALMAALERVGQKPVLPMAAATLSIMDRVALDMEHLPPPPVSTGIQPASPTVTDSSFVVPPPPTSEVSAQVSAPITPDDSPIKSAYSPKMLVIGAFILLLLLIGGWSLFGGRDKEGEEIPTAVSSLADLDNGNVSPTAVSTKPNHADENPTTLLPSSKTNDENTTILPPSSEINNDLFLPVVQSTGDKAVPEQDVADVATSDPTPTITPTATQEPSPTPAPPTTYQLAINRDKNTLFVTNLSDTPLALTSLILTFEKKGPFSNWTESTLSPRACILLVKDDKPPSDKLDKTPCQQSIGTVEQKWDDAFSVSYQDMEIGNCKVKGSDDCQLEWELP